jgi:hypothetical protein
MLIDVRYKRSQFLSDCDWTQLPDNGMTQEKRAEWVVYRQQLRDITNGLPEDINLEDVVFPITPSK